MKLKVLYIIDTLEGYGAEKSLVEITRNFKNVTPVFIHIYQGNMLKPTLEAAGIKVYSFDMNEKYAFQRALKRLIPIYLKEKPDIVHATLFRSEIIARKLKKNFPEICLVGSFVSNAYSTERYRGKNFFDRLKLTYIHNLDRRTSKYVDYFISNSRSIKDITANKLGVQKDKVNVIYRGRNYSNYVEVYSSMNNGKSVDNEIRLLNVSRLIPLKGQLDLIQALPHVLEYFPNVKLLFAGHGPFRQNLEDQVEKLGLVDNVEFLGRIEKIPELLNEADVFVYPSYSEGLPGALIEAMMAGKIIVASNIPENLECIDENCALVFEKGNIEDLSNKLIKVLNDPDRYKERGLRARRIAKDKFDICKIVSQYEHTYLDFLKR